jgi:hypothetical protein
MQVQGSTKFGQRDCTNEHVALLLNVRIDCEESG